MVKFENGIYEYENDIMTPSNIEIASAYREAVRKGATKFAVRVGDKRVGFDEGRQKTYELSAGSYQILIPTHVEEEVIEDGVEESESVEVETSPCDEETAVVTPKEPVEGDIDDCPVPKCDYEAECERLDSVIEAQNAELAMLRKVNVKFQQVVTIVLKMNSEIIAALK